MQIPIEQLLNLPDIQDLNVEITEHEISEESSSNHSGRCIRRRISGCANFGAAV